MVFNKNEQMWPCGNGNFVKHISIRNIEFLSLNDLNCLSSISMDFFNTFQCSYLIFGDYNKLYAFFLFHFLLMQIEYPEIEDLTKPRHRFMSSFEQVFCVFIIPQFLKIIFFLNLAYNITIYVYIYIYAESAIF